MRTKILAILFIIFIIIFSVQSIIYSLSYLALINNKIINFPGIISVQKDIYFKGYRKLWQEKKECIDFSMDLIYVPSFNKCLFENPEFKTVLNFNEYGRKNENSLKESNIPKKGIAVLGDSEAMGWGVNNNETFSSIIERSINKKTYNLGVSSYGTYRQLLRLEKLGLANKVDTIIIQYNPNDFNENRSFGKFDKNKSQEAFQYLIDSGALRKNKNVWANAEFILARFKSSFRVFYVDLFRTIFLKKERAEDFKIHYETLLTVLNKFNFRKNKKVFIFYLGDNVKFKNYTTGYDKNLKNIFFLDLTLKNNHFFNLDGHLNIEGHKDVAKQLVKYLDKQK